jgi:threonine/homoserine/homoserine lactone efflux protein
MAPGPVTAAAIGMGTRSRYAGMLIAIGHGIVEFPLIVLIVLGLGRILKLPTAQIIIGLAGGTFFSRRTTSQNHKKHPGVDRNNTVGK